MIRSKPERARSDFKGPDVNTDAQEFRFKLLPVEVPPVNTEHRRIRTKIPVPESLPILQSIARYESSNVKDFPPVIWSRAKDYFVEDDWGNRWIDMTSTIFVANAGHGNQMVIDRIADVMAKPLLHAYCYPTPERAAYLEKLAAFMPPYLQKFSLYSAGTEATERALKLARIHGEAISPTKKIVVAGQGNYHGKTLGAQMMSGKSEEKTWIGYHDPNITHLPFPYPWDAPSHNLEGAILFEKHLDGLAVQGVKLADIAGMVIESFQGWGSIFYPDGYIPAMAAFCRNNDSLLICDEIQAGFGRTGKLFAYEHYGVEPDVVVCGKAVSTGFPLSIVMGRAKLIDLDPTYTSTHGGHPMACAAGLATLEAFEQLDLVNEARRKEAIFMEAFDLLKAKHPKRIKQTLGKGMVHAVFVENPEADPELPYRSRLDVGLTDLIVEKAVQKGVILVRTGLGTLKFGPPLTIPDDALQEAMDVVGESIDECLV